MILKNNVNISLKVRVIIIVIIIVLVYFAREDQLSNSNQKTES